MSIRIRFDAQLTTKSNKGDFPPDTIAAVYVTNRDGCTYQCAPVSKTGLLSVNFCMEPTKPGVKLTDRIKFHFYFSDNKDNMLNPRLQGQNIERERPFRPPKPRRARAQFIPEGFNIRRRPQA